jgi:hypothetical protein
LILLFLLLTAQAEKTEDIGPVWFDASGKKVVRKGEAKVAKIAIDHKFAAEISVDGERVANAPFAGELEVLVGRHRLTIQEPGCAPRDLDITVPEGETALPINTIGPCLPPSAVPKNNIATVGDPNQTLVYTQTESNTAAWVVVGVSAALAVAGGVFIGTHVAAANKRDKLIEEDPERFDARPVRKADNEAYAWSIASASSFAGAAVALGTAIVLFVVDTGEPPPDYNFGAGANSLSFRF